MPGIDPNAPANGMMDTRPAEAPPVTLGIIAGGGDLPVRLCTQCRDQGRDVAVMVIEGQADPDQFTGFPYEVIRIGAVGAAIDYFKRMGAGELVMAGPVKRPSFTQVRPDAEGMRLLSKLGMGAFGDDALLGRIVSYLEDEHGFRVVSVDDVMGPTGVADGCLTQRVPNDAEMADIKRGLDVLTALAPADVGQAVIIQQGLVLGVEAIEGTDELIRRCAAYRREGGAGTLIKLAKTEQDMRLDKPTIGVSTMVRAGETGLAGVAIEAGRTLIMDREETVTTADRLGLFLIAVTI